VNIAGAVGASYTVAVANLGRRLRAVVTATNAAGSAVAISGLSSVVGATIESSMTWSFAWNGKFTTVQALTVHEVPTGASVEVLCHGLGCPFAHAHAASASHHSCHKHKCKPKRPRSDVGLSGLFKGHRLGVGAQISVRVRKPAWVGKSFVFTMRANKIPRVKIACLVPSSTRPGVGC
jgi:hypothetical protein